MKVGSGLILECCPSSLAVFVMLETVILRLAGMGLEVQISPKLASTIQAWR